MLWKVFDKKTEGYGVKIKSAGVNNQQLGNELDKPIRRKFRTKKCNLNFDRKYLGSWLCRYAMHNKI